MSEVVVSRRIDPAVDRPTFLFFGHPQDCDEVASIADEAGWIVADSGVGTGMGGGDAWLSFAKSNNDAASFPDLLTAVQRGALSVVSLRSM